MYGEGRSVPSRSQEELVLRHQGHHGMDNAELLVNRKERDSCCAVKAEINRITPAVQWGCTFYIRQQKEIK